MSMPCHKTIMPGNTFSEISASGQRVVKANACKNGLAFFQSKLAEFVSKHGPGCTAACQYDCNGDALDLSLEEAHAAAVSGGEGPFSCMEEGPLTVLKVTLLLQQSSTPTPAQPSSKMASSGSDGRRRRRSRASTGALTAAHPTHLSGTALHCLMHCVHACQPQ